MASGCEAPRATLLVTVATAPATAPRSAVPAMDSFDGLGGGLRSRRRRTAAERAAVFFRAVAVAPLVRALPRVLFFVVIVAFFVLVAFFANPHLRAEPMHGRCRARTTAAPTCSTIRRLHQGDAHDPNVGADSGSDSCLDFRKRLDGAAGAIEGTTAVHRRQSSW